LKEVRALARVGGYILPATVRVEEGVIKVVLEAVTARTTAIRGSLSITEVGEIVSGREIEVKVDPSCRVSVRRLRRKLRPTDPRDRRLLKELGIGPQGFKDRADFISNLYVITISRENLSVALVVNQRAALVLRNLLKNCGASME